RPTVPPVVGDPRPGEGALPRRTGRDLPRGRAAKPWQIAPDASARIGRGLVAARPWKFLRAKRALRARWPDRATRNRERARGTARPWGVTTIGATRRSLWGGVGARRNGMRRGRARVVWSGVDTLELSSRAPLSPAAIDGLRAVRPTRGRSDVT